MKKILLIFMMISVSTAIKAQTEDELIRRIRDPKPNPQKEIKEETKIVEEKTFIEKLSDFFVDDFVDFFTPEDETLGVGYNYSEYFPITISANGTYSCLSLGMELGINADKNSYQLENYNPRYFLTISPGFYCRFMSINCGVGFMSSEYMKNIYDSSIENENSAVHTNVSISTQKLHFVIKPSVTGYIPISYEYYYITVNVGYNYIPKFKELNGCSFGVGFQWVIW